MYEVVEPVLPCLVYLENQEATYRQRILGLIFSASAGPVTSGYSHTLSFVRDDA